MFNDDDIPMHSLMNCTTVAQALGYSIKLDLVFDNKPLEYSLFVNNFRQRQKLIGDPSVELDLLIRLRTGKAKKSIEWLMLDLVVSNGLNEALCTLATDFGNPTILTRSFMHGLLGMNYET